jgi:uncharacterized protein (DUF305 family)
LFAQPSPLALAGSPSSLIRGFALPQTMVRVQSEEIRQMAQWYRSW